MHHCSWDMRELKMLQCVSCGVQFLKNIPNYALGCPLIVECFHPVLGVKVLLCTIFLGRPVFVSMLIYPELTPFSKVCKICICILDDVDISWADPIWQCVQDDRFCISWLPSTVPCTATPCLVLYICFCICF